MLVLVIWTESDNLGCPLCYASEKALQVLATWVIMSVLNNEKYELINVVSV